MSDERKVPGTEQPAVAATAPPDGGAPRPPGPSEGLERRGVLRAAGATGLLVLGASAVAACSNSTAMSGAAPQAGGGASSPGSATSGASSAAGGAASSGGAGGGIPVGSVPVGGGTIFADQKVVVTQPVAGTFKAFDTKCPHRGCAVNTVADKQIRCPCHGSAFDIATGARVAGPAQTGLSAKSVTVSGDKLTVA